MFWLLWKLRAFTRYICDSYVINCAVDRSSILPIGALDISDEISALQTEIDRLKADGINKIIVLGTSGLQKETEIAQNVEGVDVIIGADHHQFLYTGKFKEFTQENITENTFMINLKRVIK